MSNGIPHSIKYITSWNVFSTFTSRATRTRPCTSSQPIPSWTTRRSFFHVAQSHARQNSSWGTDTSGLCFGARGIRPQFTELVSRFWRGAGGPLGWWQVVAKRTQRRYAVSELWLFNQQHYRPLQAVVISLAAAGVPTALSLLPLFPSTSCSHCQPISPIYAPNVVPIALWPRVRFYFRVAVRMVVLLSILSPLVILYPVGCLHSNARAVWLHFLRLSLPWCGPAFTKWGQWVSARGDLLPSDIREVLQTLQNAAPAQPAANIKKTLERSLSMPIEQAFSFIEWEPCGSGAIATVHRAVLTPETAALCGFPAGQEVAVKVKKQGVEDLLHTDFFIMQILARLLACVPVLRDLRFDDSMNQFGVPLQQQLDFELEASNLAQFAANFRNASNVVFPRPLWPLVDREVLVETYFPGQIVRHYVNSEHPLNHRIAEIGLDAYLQMMLVTLNNANYRLGTCKPEKRPEWTQQLQQENPEFKARTVFMNTEYDVFTLSLVQDNWQHADLHPGNIIVLEQQPVRRAQGRIADALNTLFETITGYSLPGSGSTDVKLAIIDVGMTVSLQRQHFYALLQLYDGIGRLDGVSIGESMVKLRYHESRVRELDLEAFRRDIEHLFEGMDRQQFRDQTQEVCNCVLETMRRHRVTMDAAASVVLLTTLALEGWATKLDPDIRILEKICALIPHGFSDSSS